MATVRNSAIIDSEAAASAAVGEDVTHLSLWSASSSGSLLAQVSLSNNPDALVLGQRIRIAAGAILRTHTASSGFTEESARRDLRGWISGGIWVQYHDGSPGANGNNNVMNIARTSVPAGSWTVA